MSQKNEDEIMVYTFNMNGVVTAELHDTRLEKALRKTHCTKIARNLENDAQKMARFKQNAAMFNAVIKNKPERIRALVHEGADVNQPLILITPTRSAEKNEDHITLLALAIYGGVIEAGKTLLELGADINTTLTLSDEQNRQEQQTVLELAQSMGSPLLPTMQEKADALKCAECIQPASLSHNTAQTKVKE